MLRPSGSGARPGLGLGLGLGLSLCALACGGGPSPASPAATGRWKDQKGKDQEVAFMKKVVVPRMSKVFEGHDPERYDDVGCKTCHGPASADPRAFLPKLVTKDGKITAFAERPAVAKFMADSVVPAMAEAMGEPPYDPATGRGFGCGGCHAVEAK